MPEQTELRRIVYKDLRSSSARTNDDPSRQEDWGLLRSGTPRPSKATHARPYMRTDWKAKGHQS